MTRLSLLLAALALAGCPHRTSSATAGTASTCAPAAALPSPVAPGPRALVVISDLHLGFGRTGGAWHAYEDFRWADDLVEFLGSVRAKVAGPVDLVVAGDMFDLWQSDQNDCAAPGQPEAGCSEAEALHRLERALAAHDAELNALAGFATAGNRLVVLPGNHDAVLLYPAVAAALAARMKGAAYEFVPAGAWLSPDGRVLVEHGHQIQDDVNTFRDWPAPFVGECRVRRTAGEAFVRALYDRYEAKYPIVDNITDEGTGLGYIRKIEGTGAFALGGAAFLKHVLFETTRSQFSGWLGKDGAPPAWNYAAMRARGPALWTDLRAPGDPTPAVFADDPTFSPANLTTAELTYLCDAAEQLRAAAAPGEPVAAGCPTTALGGSGELGWAASFFRSRDAVFGPYVKQRAKAVTPAGKTAFEYLVFGHTHLAVAGFKPLKGAWSPVVMNSGAFQRVVSPKELPSLAARKGLAAEHALKLQPEDLPAAYDVVIATSGKAPALSCWRKDGGGAYALEPGACRR